MRVGRRGFLGLLAALALAPVAAIKSKLYPSRVVVNMADDIFLYQPKHNPLILLTTPYKHKRGVQQYRFDWLEKEL